MPDDRQIARRAPDPRRVEATPADVIGPGERLYRDATIVEGARLLREAHAQIEAELLYGYESVLLYGGAGARARAERQQQEARRLRSKRVIDRAIEGVHREDR